MWPFRLKSEAKVDTHPLADLRTRIVGIQFRSAGARSAIAQANIGDELRIVREKTNRKDYNALQVHIKKFYNARDEVRSFVGYIPREDAAKISPFMDHNNITVLRAMLSSTYRGRHANDIEPSIIIQED
ncbi:hypothetical protein [Ralstonia phage RP13]|nr:hypothetical protein [Ralstonia phage RP13]